MSEKEGPSEDEVRRPKVVDKRVSTRAAREPASVEPADEEPAQTPTAQPSPAAVTPPSAPSDGGEGSATEPPGPRAPESPFDQQPGPAEPIWTPEQEAEARRVVDQISQVPARDWVADSAVRLANVASVKLDGGQTAEAQLAIDALAALVNAIGPHMGDAEAPLRQTVAQLQMAYAEVVTQPPAGGSP